MRPRHGLRPKLVPELIALHDKAGAMQRALLEMYPNSPGALPRPFRDDLEYYDGAQFYMLHIAGALEEAGYTRSLTEDQHLLLVSTNGLNDWWMDESACGGDGARDYGIVIEAFDGINAICYTFLQPQDKQRDAIKVSDPEVRRVVNYYQYVLEQMPAESRPAIARLLISINLYQAVSLYQERGLRENLGLGGLDFEGKDIGQDELEMLERMQIEKGGIIFTYFWPYLPAVIDGIVIPDQPPTMAGTIKWFLDGNSFYARTGLARRLLEIGGVNQIMDDSCDRVLDWDRGVVTPENVAPACFARADEGWDDMVQRILRELAALRSENDDADHELVVDVARNAIAGLTLFRANRDTAKT